MKKLDTRQILSLEMGCGGVTSQEVIHAYAEDEHERSKNLKGAQLDRTK